MKVLKLILTLSLVSLITACAAPKYSASPIMSDLADQKPEVVVVKDAETREGFLRVIKSWLDRNNYKYKVENDGAYHDVEKLTIQYYGNWKWDLALFLSDAKIEAFKGGERVGRVDYRAPNTFNAAKFSDAEERIDYMLEVLFGKISAQEATVVINAPKQ